MCIRDSVIPPQTALALIVVTDQHRREVERIVQQCAAMKDGEGQPVKPKANLKVYFHFQNDRRKISEHTLKCLLQAVEAEGALGTGPNAERSEPTKKRNRTALSTNVAEGTPAVKMPAVHMLPYKHAMLGGVKSQTMHRGRNLTVAEELNQSQLHYCEPIHAKDPRRDNKSILTPVFAQLNPAYVQRHILSLIHI